MTASQTLNELAFDLGETLRRLRLNKNLDQRTLAARADVSVRALRNIEAGQGSTVKTLLSVVRSLDRESWLQTLAPVPTVNPLTLTSRASERVRASSPMVKVNAAKRLVAAAKLAEGEGRPAPGTPAELHAARRLLATASRASEQPPKSRNKA